MGNACKWQDSESTELSLIEGEENFVLRGESHSLAKSLYSALHEDVTWPTAVFGGTDQCKAWIIKESAAGVFRVWLNKRNPSALEPDASSIGIFLDGVDISDSSQDIRRVLRDIDEEPPAPPTPIRLAALGSAKLAYIRDVYEGFCQRLKELGVRLDPDPPVEKFGETQDSPTTPQGRTAWRSYVEHLLNDRVDRVPPQYWIAVGTQAAMALQQFYGDDFGIPGKCPPVIFLGVTYPVALHSVDSLRSRCEPREVCGVAYGGDGLRTIVAMIHHRIVPGSRIRFVYFADFPQDLEAANHLRQTRLFAEGKLDIVEATFESLATAIDDEQPVYVSWFTFESIFEDGGEQAGRLVRMLKKRKVVCNDSPQLPRWFGLCCMLRQRRRHRKGWPAGDEPSLFYHLQVLAPGRLVRPERQ